MRGATATSGGDTFIERSSKGGGRDDRGGSDGAVEEKLRYRVEVIEYTREDVVLNGLFKEGVTTLFDWIVINLYVES